MATAIQIDRFTRLKQTVSGSFRPQQLPRLAEYLAGNEGEIHYSIAGNLDTDASGSQKRSVKCIISGWFLLADPLTLQPCRRDLSIESRLILVASEQDLPPLEMEADDEDFVVCGNELDVLETVEEEVLLDIALTQTVKAGDGGKKASKSGAPGKPAVEKISPFAKLAELKNK